MSRQQKWLLTIYVSDLNVEKTLEVTGQTFVGNLMVELVNRLGVSRDWSDHALWWPQRKTWLLRSRVTLDICGVQADSKLQFTPKHKNVHLQLPDLQFTNTTVDFSKKVFHAVTEICTNFGIRHPEELSLLRPPVRIGDKRDKRSQRRSSKRRNSQGSIHSNNSDEILTSATAVSSDGRLAVPGQQNRAGTGSLNGSLHSASTPGSPRSHRSFDSGDSENHVFSKSPSVPSQETMETLFKAKSLHEKVVFHSGWLDSSRSLMEQDVEEDEHLMLRFKYYSFFDLKPALDEVRINQLYEQAKWSVQGEEVDCTEEEVMTFAALQFQVNIASSSPPVESKSKQEQDDDIASALNDLQLTLEGTSSPAAMKTLNQMPELSDWLMLIKHKMLGMKDKKKFWCVFRDTYFSYYKSNEAATGAPIHRVNLRGCEVYPEVNVQKEKYCIKLKFPDNEEISDLELGLSSETQYAKWMGAFRLAAKGKTMADSSYDSEVHGIEAFLDMQRNKDKFSNSTAPGGIQIQPEDFVPSRIMKKYKTKQVAARILEAHSSLNLMTVMEAKMNYIRKWQELPDFGITHYGVKFRGDKVSKKEEILGIGDNKITKIDASSGKVMNSWRYSVMRSWNVNWETKEMIIDCEGERIRFICTSADIKSIHEFIGGYIFLSMRKDVNQPVDHELFFKLTGGSVQ